MAYAFNKMDEYLRGRKSGQQLPGSQSIGKGPTLPAGGGMQASKGVPQSAGASTGRAILEKAGSEGVDESLNRMLRPAAQQATGLKTQIGTGGENYFQKETQNIASKYAVPENISDVVSKAATGDTDAATTLRQGMTIQPYTPPKPPEMAINALQPTEYLKAGNVGTYLQKTSGGRYTPGMGLIDAMQMQKNRAGAGVAQAIGDIQSGVRDAYKATEQYAPQLQETAKTTQEATQAAIRQAITEKQNAINEAIQAAIAKAQQAQSEIDAGEALSAETALAGIGKPPDISQYIGRSEKTRAFNTPEIGQYNTLAGLLGGDLMVDPMITDIEYNPDEAGLRDWLARTVIETPQIQEPMADIPETAIPPGTPIGSPGGDIIIGDRIVTSPTGYEPISQPPAPPAPPAPVWVPDDGVYKKAPEIGPRADEVDRQRQQIPQNSPQSASNDALGGWIASAGSGAVTAAEKVGDYLAETFSDIFGSSKSPKKRSSGEPTNPPKPLKNPYTGRIGF